MKKLTPKNWLFISILFIILLVIYFMVADHLTPNTQDAFARTYVAQISPQVAGKITRISVNNNQFVKKGALLIQIDPRPYQYAYQAAVAKLSEAKTNVAALRAQIDQMKALILERQANLSAAAVHLSETQILASKGYATTISLVDSRQNMADKKEALQEAQDKLVITQQQLGQTIDGVNVHIKQAEAVVSQALFNLNSTTIRAPVNGTIINLHLSLDNYARPGDVIMALVEQDNWWIQANLAENSLSRVRINQPALISLSVYPGELFHGHVLSIGSGVNLGNNGIPNNYLPYVEKTHDWIRLPQRFPVQIILDDFPKDKALRTGASAYVTIFTGKHFFWNSLAYVWHWIYSMFQYFV